jgi:Na+/proline symporter
MDQAGGLDSVVSHVKDIRPDAMKIAPPSESFGIPLLLVLLLQGFFFAGSPTAGEGSTAQRFMAAKSEREAMKGQLFNTFLALSLRTIPLIGIGIVCMTLFTTRDLLNNGSIIGDGMTILDDPVHAWGSLINHSNLPDGLRGLLIAVEVAAYLSTLSTLINWGSSFVVNDLLPKSLLRNKRQEVAVSRVSTLLLFIGAGFVAVMFVDNMVSWFVFINSAMVIFLLPLSWFRFFWWRFNAWGELAAVVLGLPMSIVVWFVLDFQNRSMWQGLAILFGLSFLVLILITLITKPEDKDLLRSFYERCRPVGWWGPVTGPTGSEKKKARINLLLNSALGIISAFGLVLFTNALFSGSAILVVSGTVISLSAGYALIRRLRHNSVNFTSK